jgi:transposase InsO family protein
MAQKLEFIEKARAPGANISALCREYGISRQTGHKWLRRYHERGYGGLVEQSRRPHSSPLATGEDIVVGILELREQHATWGPDKISRVLARTLGDDAPSKSTVARVLQRVGRIKRRRPRVRLWSVEGRPYVEVKAPNDLWTIDIKGWWRARNGEKCEPLTVRDACSRKVLAVTLLARTRTEDVRGVLQELFLRHGLPAAIQCDNGSPFVCTRARGGLSALSAWLISLGIRLVRSRPGCPQDNGGHERMHRDLSELELRPARSRRAQQRLCDRWMLDFNEIRPHDALGGKTPSEVYRDSERRSLTPLLPSYPPEWTTRRVSRTGNVCINGDSVFISMSVARHVVGLRQESVLRWRVLFFGVDLGCIEIAPIRDAVSERADGPVSAPVTPLKRQPSRVSAPPRPRSRAPRTRLSPRKRRALPPSRVSAMS